MGERKMTRLWAGLLGFLAGFAAIGLISSGMKLHGISMPGAALFCAAAAAVLTLCTEKRWLTVGLLGAGLLWCVRLWRTGPLNLSLEALLYHISLLYSRGYGWGYIRWSTQPLQAYDSVLALRILAVPVMLAVIWGVMRPRWAFTAAVAAFLPLVPCMLLTDTVPNTVYIFLQFLCILLLLLPRLTRQQNAKRGNTLTALLALPVALCLGLMLLLVPKEGYRGAELLDRIATGVEELVSRFAQSAQQGTVEVVVPDPGAGAVNLSYVGPKWERKAPVMRIRPDSSGVLYLRGEVYDAYTGTSWEASREAPLMSERLPAGIPKRVVITTLQTHGMLYVPYVTLRLQDDTLPKLKNGILRNTEGLKTYTAVYLPQFSPDSSWEEPVEASPEYLQLPADTLDAAQAYLSTHLPDLPEGVWQQAKAITAHVRQSAPYSLQTPKMPEGAGDFALWFLEESNSGYCIHFATAATVLLRAAGIPARYVTGYMGYAKANRETTLRQRDSHAWAECYINGVGWVKLEATPADGLPEEAPTEETTLTRPTQPTETEETTLPTGDTQASNRPTKPSTPTDPQETQEATRPTEEKPTPKPSFKLPDWTGTVLNYLLLAACILGQWQLRLWLRRRRLKKASPNRRALLLWQHVQWHCRLRKLQPPQELLSLAQKARFSPYTLTAEELGQLSLWLDSSTEAIRSEPLYIRLAATLLLALC